MTDMVWRQPSMRWFYRWNRAIPVAVRGGNRDALRAARSVLHQGRVVGIFPEGGLSRDGLPLLGNPGAVSLVLEAGIPIVPVGIVGADLALAPGAFWPRPRRVTVRFGAPIVAADLDALDAADRRGRLVASTRLFMDRIAALTGQTSREAVLAAHVASQPGSRTS
jgi:1-acyl-sn-glycerol-3-phosphate acyltransferase